MRRSAPSSAHPCRMSTPAMPHMNTLRSRSSTVRYRRGQSASEHPPARLDGYLRLWRRSSPPRLGCRARNRRGRAPAVPRAYQGTRARISRRTRSNRQRSGGSARIGRGERDERRRIFRWRASENDEDRSGTKGALNGRFGKARGGGDVSDDVVEVVVIEEADLRGGIGRLGIGQRRQRDVKRDDDERETETEDSQRHVLIRYYQPMRRVNQ